MITTVVFDMDETLLDLRPAVDGALQAVADEVGGGLTLAGLQQDWAVHLAAMAAEPVTAIRRAALAASLARVGAAGRVDELLVFYFARRFALSRPYPDVLPVLAALRGRYRLGLATNGNSAAARCGLAGAFDFEVYAHRGGVPKKPDPGFYAAVAEAAGARPAEIVHIGDNLEHDVAGPERAGMRAVWLNRSGRPGDAHPTVPDLHGLPALLGELLERW